MSIPVDDSVAISARVAKLERENSRLKRLVVGLAMLSSVSALVGAGSFVRRGSAQETGPRLEGVQAYEFTLRDAAGRTRAQLHFGGRPTPSPELVFFDETGRTRLSIMADEMGTSIVTYSADGGRYRTMSTADVNGADISSYVVEKGAPKGTVGLFASPGLTQMTVWDAEGFRTTVGNAPLPGATPQKPEVTSAASVVMYGKGGTVLWQAPPKPTKH